MNSTTEHSAVAVGMSRFVVGAISVGAIGLGVTLVTVVEGAVPTGGGIALVIAGIAGLLRASAKRGAAPVESAKDVVDVVVGEE